MGGGAGQRSGRQSVGGQNRPFAEFGGPRMRQMLADFERRNAAAPSAQPPTMPAAQPMMPGAAPTQMTTQPAMPQPAMPMAPTQTGMMEDLMRQAEAQRAMSPALPTAGGIGAFAQPMNPMMNDQARMAAEAAALQRMQNPLMAIPSSGPLPPTRMATPEEMAALGVFNAPQPGVQTSGTQQPGMSPKGPTAGLSPAQVFQPQLSQMRPTR
jgi:hypothetical protein